MTSEPDNPVDVKRPICHEAGHAVVALHFGFRVGRIEVFRGKPRAMIDLDWAQEMRKCCVVLAGGIAAERLVLGDEDFEGSRSDRERIAERGGDVIETYLAEACSIIHSHESCLRRLRNELGLKWTMELAESAAVFNFNAASDSISFVLLSRDDIEAIWMAGC